MTPTSPKIRLLRKLPSRSIFHWFWGTSDGIRQWQSLLAGGNPGWWQSLLAGGNHSWPVAITLGRWQSLLAGGNHSWLVGVATGQGL